MSGARIPLLLALLAALAFAGCGIANPYDERRADSPAPKRARDVSAPPAETAEAAPTAEASLRYAALLAGNWTSAGIPRNYHRLAQLSVGDARTEFNQVAAGGRTDVQQRRAGARARATVEAVVMRDDGDDDVRHAIVVTRAWFTNPELAYLPVKYKITLATVERRDDRWVIATWRPQP